MSGEIPSGSAHAPLRKRAALACLACRARKVRCDVSERGPPCMHCRLDHGECIVKARPAKYRKIRVPSQSGHFGFSGREAPKRQDIAQSSIQSLAPEEKLHALNFFQAQDEDSSFENCPELSIHQLDQVTLQQVETQDVQFGSKNAIEESGFGAPTPMPYFDPTVLDDVSLVIESGSQGFMNTHVIYSYYPFLGLDTLPYMTPEDVNFLEAQGCFRLPVRPLLDHFVKEYYLHVHPGLPIINEGIFWEIYTNRSSQLAEQSRISLFVFQAMIFASSCFVTLEVIRNLGFTNARTARAAYYRRAKLLFDFEGDRNPISTAQGALLLSYHPPIRNHNKINTFWLGIAIQFAKDAGAHRYQTNKNLNLQKKNILKRLWWCCILRDRIISLGLRRPLQLESTHLVAHQPPLSVDDLQSEVGRSKVHSPSTKVLLNQLTAAICELATVLTEVIKLAYPLHDSIDSILSNEGRANRSLSLLAICRSSLAGWFKKTFMSFPQPSGVGNIHKSVILYTDLMYIYYHSAIIALSQFEILLSAKGPVVGETQRHRICRSKAHLEEAASSFTDILKELNRLQLTKVAYAALPLVLHILDVKLTTTEIHQERKQERLKIYSETMKVFKSQYDVTEEVSDIIATMINYVSVELPIQKSQFSITDYGSSPLPQFQHMKSSTVSSSVILTNALGVVKSWGGVLVRQPNLYLRFALTIDLALEIGHFPEDSDFPVALQWRNTTTTRFPMYRITMGDIEYKSGSSAEAEKASRENQPVVMPFDLPDNENTTNSESGDSLRTSMSSATNSFIDQMLSMTTHKAAQENSELDISMDFGAFEVAGLIEEDVDFNCTTAWPEETCLTGG